MSNGFTFNYYQNKNNSEENQQGFNNNSIKISINVVQKEVVNK
jgi:hypothetical protein